MSKKISLQSPSQCVKRQSAVVQSRWKTVPHCESTECETSLSDGCQCSWVDASSCCRPQRRITMNILWNTLPVDIQSSPSLPVFRQRLKTFLFHKSFPDVVWQADYAFVDLVMAYCYFSHVKNFLIDWLIFISTWMDRCLLRSCILNINGVR